MIYIKIQYGSSFKKLQLLENELNWQHLTALLSRSFHLSNKDGIKLTYKDSEGDQITVKNDSDLIEAQSLCPKNQILKLLLTYKLDIQNSVKNEMVSSKISNKSSVNEKIENLEEKRNIDFDFKELQEVFDEIFSHTEALEKLSKKLNAFCQESHIESIDNFKVSIDPFQLAEYFKNKLTYHAKDEFTKKQQIQAVSDESITAVSIIQLEKVAPIEEAVPVKDVTPTEKVESSVEIEHKEEEPEKVLEESKEAWNKALEAGSTSLNFDSIHNTKLMESIYEPILNTELEESIIIEEKKVERRNSINVSKSLADSCGFRFILKYENGKPKFVAVPATHTSINSSKQSQDISPKSSEAKEFENKILKNTSHDLDDDLPAPYGAKPAHKKTI